MPNTFDNDVSTQQLISHLRGEMTIDGIPAVTIERMIADRLEEFNRSPAPQHVKARKKRASRADRFSEAQGLASDAKAQFEELRDELQNWLDNMPEGLQGGSKAEQLEEAISALDDVINSCDEVEGASVEFPGMMG